MYMNMNMYIYICGCIGFRVEGLGFRVIMSVYIYIHTCAYTYIVIHMVSPIKELGLNSSTATQ